jgi:putative ABC transport system permease protein
MERTLRDQVDGARSGWARLALTARALRRLPRVIVAEWGEWLGLSADAASARTRRDREGIMQDVARGFGLALRSLRKAPTFAVASILLMALGVGVVTTVFTIVDHVLLRPLPYPAAERLTYLTNGSHNGPTLERLNAVEVFEAWTATSSADVNLSRVDGDPLRLRRMETTPAFFTLFAARPQLGRLFVDADRDRIDIAVLTHAFWRDVFGSDREVVGSTMQVDGAPIEIVGVLSEDFVHPSRLEGEPHFYRPLDWSNEAFQRPGYHAHSVLARLAPGVSLEQANQRIDRLEADVAAAHPEYYAEGPQDWPLVSLHDTTVEDVRGSLLLLLGAVSLLLLVACVNVAHLFMARGLARTREMAVRRAMGAGTRNLLGQLTRESLVVGVAGGVGGLLIAQAALSFFRRWTVELPRGANAGLDLRVFLVCFGLATMTALIFGLLPAFRSVGRDVQAQLRAGGRGMSGGRGVQAFRSGLVVFEVAVSLVLVASAGLLMRSFLTVTAIDPGVEPEGVWVFSLTPANVETAEDYRTRMDAILSAVERISGVTSVAYGLEMPFENVGGNRCCWGNRFTPPDEPEATPLRIALHGSSEDYFTTLGTEIVAGEVWDRLDAGGSPRPVVVSEAFAVRVFGSAAAAVGRELPEVQDGSVIVGVAEDTRHYGLDQEHDYAIYLPVEAVPFAIPRATFALRVADAPGDLARSVREAVWSEEAALPVPSVEPLEGWLSGSSATRRFGSVLFGAFGAVALLLAGAGLYGTLLYTVGQRRQELGIRLALGAGRARIQNEVIRTGVAQAALGVLCGGLAAHLLGGLLESWLYGVSDTDPIALGSAAAVLFATAVTAAWFPAYRAGRTNPLETLKAE